MIRSHEVKQDGYEVAHDGKCITVFSAPNYWYTHTHAHTHTHTHNNVMLYMIFSENNHVCSCFHSDQMGNKGAFITLSRDLKPHFTTYEAVVSAHYIIITSSFIPSLPPSLQPHPKAKPMQYASPLFGLLS